MDRKQLPLLSTLLAFEAAGRLASFTGAARELNISQAAVSKQIKQLEQHVGTQLFTRRHRAVDDFLLSVHLGPEIVKERFEEWRVFGGRTEILGAFETQLVPSMKTFRPELVLISAGFDSREGDPLGKFRLTDRDFADLTTTVREIAADSANSRVVSVLEGGYSLEGLAKGVLAHVQALK